MLLAAISDLHGHVPSPAAQSIIDKADVLCISGDVDSPSFESVEWIASLRKPVVLTPGNHDRFFSDPEDERFNWGLEPHIHVLIDKGCEIDGVRFWGTPWSPIFCDWAFMLPPDGLREKFAKIPKGIDVLISHVPPAIPRGRIGVIQGQNTQLGSRELYEAVCRAQPRFLFCGHIHTGNHERCRIVQTECYNVSYLNEQYEPTYLPRLVEIEPR